MIVSKKNNGTNSIELKKHDTRLFHTLQATHKDGEQGGQKAIETSLKSKHKNTFQNVIILGGGVSTNVCSVHVRHKFYSPISLHDKTPPYHATLITPQQKTSTPALHYTNTRIRKTTE